MSAAFQPGPNDEAILAQLQRIAAAPAFTKSASLIRFLKYVVYEKLAHRENELKEYSIGRAVFEKKEDFQTGTDSTVRTAAGRLRGKLREYYAATGLDDDLLIDLPVGTYAPTFTIRTPRPAVPAPAPPPIPAPVSAAAKPGREWLWRVASIAVLVLLTFTIVRLLQRSHGTTQAPSRAVLPRRLLLGISETSLPMRMDSEHGYEQLRLSPDGKELFGLDRDNAINIFSADDLRTIARIRLPHPGRGMAISHDGRRLYVSSTAPLIMVIDAVAGRLLDKSMPIHAPTFDIAVTPDSRKMFLAMGNAGLGRIDLSTGESRVLSSMACPLHLDLDRAGRRLYVAYECGGPGGSPGRDTVEIYDAETEQHLGQISGPPMVSDHPLFATNDELVMLDMRDACVAAYKLSDCPGPSVGFHLWSPSSGKFLSTHTFPRGSGMAGGGAFFPSSSRFVFPRLQIWDWARNLTLEKLPDSMLGNEKIALRNHNTVAISPSEGRLFAAANQTGIFVLNAESESCQPIIEGLTNFYPFEGTNDDFTGEGALKASRDSGYAQGRVGRALRFDGARQFLKAEGTSPLCPSCADSWTVAFFIWFDALGTEQSIINRLHGDGVHDLDIWKASDDHLVVKGHDGVVSIRSAKPMDANRWHHIAVATHKPNRSLYIDGILQGSAPLPPALKTVPESYTGTNYLGAFQGKVGFLKGMIDEITVYNRALDASEIQTLSRVCPAGR